MSKKREEKEYKESVPYRFSKWLKGEEDPFIGRLEMKPQRPNEGREWLYDPSDYEEIKKRSMDYTHNKSWQGYGKLYRINSVLVCLALITILICAVSYLPSVGETKKPTNNEVPERYITKGLEETGAVNIVTGMILNYRAFDTFGESTVLFAATGCVMLILLTEKPRKGDRDSECEGNKKLHSGKDPILRIIAKIVCQAVFLFGIYVILNGHLSPGGGFSGGAIIGAGLILYTTAYGFEKTERFFSKKTYTGISVLALSFYCLAKSYSFFTGANHLTNLIPNGTPGKIISSGLILPLNICVGLVVSGTVYAFYALFRKGGL